MVSQWLSLLVFFVSQLFHPSLCDIGTAAQYSPPYLPTACYQDDTTQFPSNNLFAAAGEGIWDNRAACGRQYSVRCISSSVAGSCKPDQIIQVKIVDYVPASASPPSADGATIVLSEIAFATITDPSTAPAFVNIEYQQA